MGEGSPTVAQGPWVCSLIALVLPPNQSSQDITMHTRPFWSQQQSLLCFARALSASDWPTCRQYKRARHPLCAGVAFCCKLWESHNGHHLPNLTLITCKPGHRCGAQ